MKVISLNHPPKPLPDICTIELKSGKTLTVLEKSDGSIVIKTDAEVSIKPPLLEDQKKLPPTPPMLEE